MPPSKHATVLIAGGSIAGLTLANALERVGIDYLVLEKWHEIAPEVGASIVIFPNGARILDQLGCYEDIVNIMRDGGGHDVIMMRSPQGKVLYRLDSPKGRFLEQQGYEPIFVDRRMVIQILYEKLKDKSKILLGHGITRVEQFDYGVRVETKSGTYFTGSMLVGADGIHSTTRQEMWRLSDVQDPRYFPPQERHEVPTHYCCIFGISRGTPLLTKTVQYILGDGYSYLIASAPGDRVYWFLFKKLEVAIHGLHDRIPRYTNAERDALAKEHATDSLGNGLTFKDLYELQIVASLQALPEAVFKKWHWGRIVTIGDAAHKYNPIGGQGGNSAIEDAAALTNELVKLVGTDSKSTVFSDAAAITEAFASFQAKRHKRVTKMNAASHTNQSIQAMESALSKFIANYLLPLATVNMGLSALLSSSRAAVRLEMLPVPERPHKEFFYDERPTERRGYAGLKGTKVMLSGIVLLLICVYFQELRAAGHSSLVRLLETESDFKTI